MTGELNNRAGFRIYVKMMADNDHQNSNATQTIDKIIVLIDTRINMPGIEPMNL
jgi:hypothetical protein